MIREQDLRNAVMDVKFALQGGVHDGFGRDISQFTPEQALDALLQNLGVKIVTVKPFYVVHWNPANDETRPHVMSHISGRKYALKTKNKDVEIGSTLYDGIELKTVATKPVIEVAIDGKYSEYETEKQVKDAVGKYERERGITR